MASIRALFEPLPIGPVTVSNRIVMAATAGLFSIADGLVSKREVYFLREVARGGVGLIVTGNRLVHPLSSAPRRGHALAWVRDNVKRDRVLTETVHAYGARILVQLNHYGACGTPEAGDDYRHLLSSSALAPPGGGEIPKAMDEADMEEVAAAWADSAEIAAEAGFDGVELQMAGGGLLQQFLSPLANRRVDGFGGTLEGRLRYPLQVLERVRARLGRGVVIGVRLCAEEGAPGGIAAAEAIEIARRLAATGDVDYLSITGGSVHGRAWEIPPAALPEGRLVGAAARVRRVVGVPVMVAGAIVRPETLAGAVADGKVDAVALSRALLADPELARKLAAGSSGEVTHCIRCNQGCVARPARGGPVACTVNPSCGREEVFGAGTLRAAGRRGRWVVAGAGPAGMRAAWLLAARGHEVILYEAAARVGGQVNLIAKQPGRRGFRALIDDLAAKLAACGVEPRLKTHASAARILADAPDGVVIATGARPCTELRSRALPASPPPPGAAQDNVITAWDVLRNPRRAGRTVMVFDDEGTPAVAATVRLLLERGHRVHVVTPFAGYAPGTAATLEQPLVYAGAFAAGLTVTPNAWVRAIKGGTATLVDLHGGEQRRVQRVDTFVLACGALAVDGLYAELAGAVPRLYRIGDCLAPRDLDRALYEAELAGRELLDEDARFIQTGALDGWDDYVVSAAHESIARARGAKAVKPVWAGLPRR